MVIRTKNGKESTLLDVYNNVSSVKSIEKILYFGVFLFVSLLILPRFDKVNLIEVVEKLQCIYVIIFLSLSLGLAMYSSFKSTKPKEQSTIHYILLRSFLAFNSDFAQGWILFIIYSIYLIAQTHVYLPQYNLIFVTTTTIILSVLFIFVPALLRFFDRYGQRLDLESIIFKDGLKKVKIKLYIGSSPEIKGEIEDIKDELTVCTNKSSETGTLYVPWENILSFEIVEEIVH